MLTQKYKCIHVYLYLLVSVCNPTLITSVFLRLCRGDPHQVKCVVYIIYCFNHWLSSSNHIRGKLGRIF